jgi:hypothetical protein
MRRDTTKIAPTPGSIQRARPLSASQVCIAVPVVLLPIIHTLLHGADIVDSREVADMRVYRTECPNHECEWIALKVKGYRANGYGLRDTEKNWKKNSTSERMSG